jgi:hypothetical protein
MTNEEEKEVPEPIDKVAPARGLFVGVLLGIVLLAIVVGLYVLLRW